ncbi:MAG: stage 0 sporulation family protein [Clostridia bacterium]|nr:stage 0 sporulation family protein [Clostridia bacterium]
MQEVVGVKFKNTAKVYYFAPANDTDIYEKDSGVIVETAKGLEYGKVVFDRKKVTDDEIVKPLKAVLRKANAKDEAIVKKNEEKVPEAIKIAEEKIAKQQLKMKLVGCEFSFDCKKVIFYFTADNRVDFRELIKDLASAFKIRIELRQIGIRDETKLLGGIAPCGRACCCSSFMPDFKKVSIKMAKTQGLSLNPSKISGLCGRLMCCLSYENDTYSDLYKLMPKIGGTVKTPEGEGVVVTNNILKKLCKVKITRPDGEVYKDFYVDELTFGKQNLPDDEEIISEEELKELLD